LKLTETWNDFRSDLNLLSVFWSINDNFVVLSWICVFRSVFQSCLWGQILKTIRWGVF
jgi:hypothetical protein